MSEPTSPEQTDAGDLAEALRIEQRQTWNARRNY
jgi:hypothetical protein